MCLLCFSNYTHSLLFFGLPAGWLLLFGTSFFIAGFCFQMLIVFFVFWMLIVFSNLFCFFLSYCSLVVLCFLHFLSLFNDKHSLDVDCHFVHCHEALEDGVQASMVSGVDFFLTLCLHSEHPIFTRGRKFLRKFLASLELSVLHYQDLEK